jgi:murein DD-endopeptidase MepM/ murein hydrolase activator NlpD
MVSPIDIPLFLSGNFGELRNDHFHSGIDIKTQGLIGLPVKSVKEGYISRISVSPYGYGRAVYINHPDGKTSVYGHLDHFASKIESAVRDSQYLKESFTVNLFFSPGDFPLKKGEVFAFSGNKGGSAAPHLHFEIRDTRTEKILDPLPWFKNRIKDTRPPEIREVLVFPQTGMGLVNGKPDKQALSLFKNKSGKLAAQPVKAWGYVGIGIKAYDRMDETTNIYGVNEVILWVDNVEVFHSTMTSFSFDNTRYLNSFIDWNEWKENKSFYMKSFIDPCNHFDVYRSFSDGVIPVLEERNYHCKYILKDIYGNSTSIEFDITGEKQTLPSDSPSGLLVLCNKDNSLKEQGIELNIPSGNLYTNAYLLIEASNPFSAFAPLYSVGKRMPLHSYCPLTLDIPNDTYPDKSKYGVVSIVDGKISWLGGKYDARQITTKIRELGEFSVEVDDIPPVITPINPAKWRVNKRISFGISDNLSGMQSYRGSIDGKFVLFEYESKTATLYCEYDPQRMKTSSGILKLAVTDKAGNQSEFSTHVEF